MCIYSIYIYMYYYLVTHWHGTSCMRATAASTPLMFLEQLQGSQDNGGTYRGINFCVLVVSPFFQPSSNLKQVTHNALWQLAQGLWRVLAASVLVRTD